MTNFFSLNDLGLSSSSSQLLLTWLQTMQDTYPGYTPSASNLEYIQAQIFASFATDLANLCSNGATELFRTYATTLVGVPYQQGVAAQAIVSIAAQSSDGTIATTSSALSTTGGSIAGISVVALQYGIAAGSITLTDPTLANTQTFTTSGALAGDTFIPVTAAVPNYNYPAGSTFTGTQAYSLPALTQFALDTFGFTNLAPTTINAGTSQNITLTAVATGQLYNGAGSGGAADVIQQLGWINGVSIVTAATGGIDPEDDATYLNRVKVALQLQAPRPITASDYGTMAINFDPYPGTDQQEVGRATAVDGYNPTDGTYNNERMVTVAVTDANGFALNNDTLYGYPGGTSSNIITAVPSVNAGWGITGWLESLREVNFVVNVISPVYSAIYVTVQVKAASGWDTTSVQQSVQNALLGYLSPQIWGLPTTSSLGWQNVVTVYQSALMAVIQGASGVDHIVDGTLRFGFTASPSNSTDLALPGPIALPTSSTSTIPLSAITVNS